MKKFLILITVLVSTMLFKNDVYAYEEYKVGDKINYLGEDYYVIKNSDNDKDYVTLLKAKVLSAKEIKNNGGGYNSTNSQSNCTETFKESQIYGILSNWSHDFEDDLVEVDGYKVRLITKDELIDNLGFDYKTVIVSADIESQILFATEDTPWWVVNGMDSYFGLNESEDGFLYSVDFEPNQISCRDYGSTGDIRPVINLKKYTLEVCRRNYRIDKVQKYANYSGNTGMSYKNSHFEVLGTSNENNRYTLLISDGLKQEDIYKYSNGLYNSVTVPYYISDTCNSEENMSGCKNDYNSSIIKMIVDNWVNDNFEDDDLMDMEGYKARLLTIDELVNQFGYEPSSWSGVSDGEGYSSTGETPYYISQWEYNSSYWTMSQVNDSSFKVFNLYEWGQEHTSQVVPNYVFNSSGKIRPVVKVDKCLLGGGCWEEDKLIVEDSCSMISDGSIIENKSSLSCKAGINYVTKQIINYNNYSIGDVVNYNGDKYYVIENSDNNTNYLTLLKDRPLTKDELYKYGKDVNDHLFVNEYTPNTDDPEDVIAVYEDDVTHEKIGGMAYYTSKSCGFELEWNISSYNHINYITEGCKNNYDESDVKKVVDNWGLDKLNNDDLVEVNGYKVRLISEDDLVNNLEYELSSKRSPYTNEEIWFYKNTDSNISSNFLVLTKGDFHYVNDVEYLSYWTMIPNNNDNTIFIFERLEFPLNGGFGAININTNNYATVRPVVNIDKCAIEGGCEIEEVTIEDGCIEDTLVENTTVNKNKDIMAIIVAVGNTLSSISGMLLVICGILIICGISFLGYSYIKSKKEFKNNLKK